MLKSFQQWLSCPLLLLAAALLLAGCASGGEQRPAADTAAVQSPQPESQASPLPGDAAGSAVPSASADGTAASPSGAESAGTAGGAAANPPPAASGAASGHAPSDSAVTESAPVTGSTAAPAADQPAPASAGPATAGPAQPADGARPSSGIPAAAKPAATARPPAAVQPPAAAPSAVAQPAAADSVTLSIVGDKEHGTILAAAAVGIEDGESALELLKRITRKNKIPMEYQGAASFAYVEGIDNLYEFDHGPESGWMYRVNGKIPGKGAGSYTLNPGDIVEWLYTLDLGKDVGAEVQ